MQSTIIIHTRNSVYEVRGKQVRRLSGVNPPYPGFCGEDWVEFVSMTTPTIGLACYFDMPSGETVHTSTVQLIAHRRGAVTIYESISNGPLAVEAERLIEERESISASIR